MSLRLRALTLSPTGEGTVVVAPSFYQGSWIEAGGVLTEIRSIDRTLPILASGSLLPRSAGEVASGSVVVRGTANKDIVLYFDF